MRRSLLFVLAGCLAAPSIAFAHGGLLSQGEYRFEDGEVLGRLLFSAQEMASSVKGADLDGDSDVTAAELETAETRAAIEKNLVGAIQVTSGVDACSATLGKMALVEGGGVELDVRWRCPDGATEASIDATFLESFDPGHRHLVTMLGTSSSDVAIAVAGNHRFTVSGAARMRPPAAAPFLRADHLLLLLVLLLAGGAPRPLLTAVGAFTAGWSASFLVAAAGWWVPPVAAIAPLTALSIAWLGIENLFLDDGGATRWRVALPVGVVHGFGFALALPRAGLPMAAVTRAVALVAVQIAALAVLLPLVLWLRRQTWFGTRGLHVASGVAVAAGATLFFSRVRGLV